LKWLDRLLLFLNKRGIVIPEREVRRMLDNNICKFIMPGVESGLSVSCFVQEGNPDAMRAKTVLPTHRISLVSRGGGSFVINGAVYPFSVGDVVFAFRGEEIYTESEGCEFMYIQFEGARADELFLRFDIRPGNRIFCAYDGLLPLWKESLSRANGQTTDLVAESMLLYTFSRLTPASTEKDGLLYQLLGQIEKKFNDPELTLGRIAEELAYNPKYVSHLFKEGMGIGFTEYLRIMRIRYAVSLFDHGLDSVRNVALLSGFSDPLYFSTVFKREVGVSPREYIAGKK